MRLPLISSTLTASTLALAAVTMVTLAVAPASAQQGIELLPLKPPPPPPIKAYKPVAVTPPQQTNDSSFAAFRKNLADIAAHKDRAALAKLVVAKGFFWQQDRDLADKGKPGIDNLGKAIDLDAADGSGWGHLAAYAAEPTAADDPDHKGVICAPALPGLDINAFQALIEDTQTDLIDWAYPRIDGVEVHAAAQPDSPVIDKLAFALVHVLPDSAAPDDPNQPTLLHVALPSGKAGFVAQDALAPLAGDQMCYIKDASGWKITGYFGGPSQ
jgi:hypothetical protein